MTERTPEEIAAGLTEAQRRTVLSPDLDNLKYSPMTAHKLCCANIAGWVPRYGQYRLALTPLGLQVRTLIEKDSRRGG